MTRKTVLIRLVAATVFAFSVAPSLAGGDMGGGGGDRSEGGGVVPCSLAGVNPVTTRRSSATLPLPDHTVLSRGRTAFGTWMAIALAAGQALLWRPLLPVRSGESADNAARCADHARAERRHGHSIAVTVRI